MTARTKELAARRNLSKFDQLEATREAKAAKNAARALEASQPPTSSPSSSTDSSASLDLVPEIYETYRLPDKLPDFSRRKDVKNIASIPSSTQSKNRVTKPTARKTTKVFCYWQTSKGRFMEMADDQYMEAPTTDGSYTEAMFSRERTATPSPPATTYIYRDRRGNPISESMWYRL